MDLVSIRAIIRVGNPAASTKISLVREPADRIISTGRLTWMKISTRASTDCIFRAITVEIYKRGS
jgi:hypothetical protein